MMIVHKCISFFIEFMIQWYITESTSTSLWTNDEKGVPKYYSINLSEGLYKNLIIPIIIKLDIHNELISLEISYIMDWYLLKILCVVDSWLRRIGTIAVGKQRNYLHLVRRWLMNMDWFLWIRIMNLVRIRMEWFDWLIRFIHLILLIIGSNYLWESIQNKRESWYYW
mgnify:CR=1 FL=1